MQAFQDATAGAVGAVCAELSTYPLGVAKTRLQAQRRTTQRDGSPRRSSVVSRSRAGTDASVSSQESLRPRISGRLPYLSTVDCLRRICSEEGCSRLYAGLGAACLKAALTNFIFFYNLRVAGRVAGGVLRKQPLLQGMAAGLAVQLVILPVDLVVTRMQSLRGGSVGFLAHVMGIVKEEGVAGLWAGLGPGALLTLNPGITQLILVRLGGSTKNVTASWAFMSGAAAKAVASLVTYPYMRAKVQMQIQGMLPPGTPRKSMMQIWSDILSESGVIGFFDGFVPQVSNAVLKDALLTMIRVKIARMVARAVALLLRPHARRTLARS